MNNRTFNRILTLIFLGTFSCLAQTGWQWQNPTPQGNTLNGIEYLDANTAVAVGEAGTILRTADGGQAWIPQRSGTDENLLSVSFSDFQNGTAVGQNGAILRTNDGGFTWTSQTSGTTGTLRSVKFTDANTGTIVEDLGNILRTVNGGSTWTQVTPVNVAGLFGVWFTSSNVGTAVGLNGRILRTTDGGTQWAQQVSGTLQHLYAVFFINANHGVAVGMGGTVLRTTNGGTVWSALNAGTFLPLYGVVFSDSMKGMAVGLPGTNHHTTDGGQTWFTRSSGTSSFLRQADFADENHGIAVGNGGTIMYTDDGGSNWVAQSSGTINSLFGVSFSDVNNGIAVGDVGTILRTISGGQVWNTQTSGTSRTLWSVSLADANNGNAVGNNGTILRTANGGLNWTPQTSGTTSQLLGVSLANQLVGTAVGVNGTILRTTNGGATWFAQFSGTTEALNGVHMVDQNTAIAVGSGGTVLRTDDGDLWIDVASGTAQALYSVCFTDALTGTVVGANGTILRTTDGGAAWIAQSAGVSNTLNSVTFSSANVGNAVGFGGRILRTDNGGDTWADQSSGTSNYLSTVDFTDANHGTAVGFNGTILHTSTGGLPPAPAFTSNAPAIDFGSVIVGSSKKDSVTITNTGTATLSISTVSSTGSRFVVTPTGASIPVSSSRKFYVTFSPVSTGSRDAEVIFTSNATGSPDSIHVTGSGTTEGFGKYLTLTPDTLGKKDVSTGKFLKAVRRQQGKYPNWANLASEVVVQGGFQPGATESDVAGGMVLGISYMTPASPTRWKPIKDSASARCWVRLSKWNLAKSYGTSWSYIQKTLEDNTGKHTGPARGFDGTGVPGDTDRRNLIRQQTRLYPRKHSNALFAELVALKMNVAASQLGKTPVGFGELVFEMQGNICDQLSVVQISAKADSMLTYWQGRPQADYDSLYHAILIINRAFLGPLDTLSFEADQELIAKGAVDLGAVSFLKPGLGPELRLMPTTRKTESEDDSDFGEEEFENADGVPAVARLYQNYPNPFNPSTTISFRLREPAVVTLRLINLLGQEVATLMSGEEFEEGYQTVDFQAEGLSSGVYLYQLRAETMENGESIVDARKLLLLK